MAFFSTCYREAMKIGLVGDTHLPRFGWRIPIALANGLREERVELIVHVGDFTGLEVPALFEAIAPLEAVAGNNDPPALKERFGHRKILDVAGMRLGLIHGDGRAGTTVSRSRAAFADGPVAVICFVRIKSCASAAIQSGSESGSRRKRRSPQSSPPRRRGRAASAPVFSGPAEDRDYPSVLTD